MLPLVLTLLAQAPTPVDLPADAVPVTASFPAVTSSGQQYVITWVDDRLGALWARRLLERNHTDLWMTRVFEDGRVAPVRRVCPAAPAERPALVAHPTSGDIFAFWFEPLDGGLVSAHRAVMSSDGRFACLPLAQSDAGANELRATWTGNFIFLAWTEGNGTIRTAWLEDAGVLQHSASVNNIAASHASLSVGAVPGRARLSFINLNEKAVWMEISERSPHMFSNLSEILRPAAETAMDPLGSFALVQKSPSPPTLPSSGAPLKAFYFTSSSDPEIGMVESPVGQPQVATFGSGETSVAAVETMSGIDVFFFSREGDMPPKRTFLGKGKPAVASNGGDALLVMTAKGTSELSATTLSILNPPPTSTPPPTYTFFLDAPQRRPSVAWASDRFIVVWEERIEGRWQTRAAMLRTENSQTEPPPTASLQFLPSLRGNLVVFNRPDGKLLVRSDTKLAPLATVTQALAVDGGSLSLEGQPLFSSSFSAGGAATNTRVMHWTNKELYVQDAGTRSFDNVTPFRSGATTGDTLWLPVVTSDRTLMSLILPDSVLASGDSLPMPQVEHTSNFNPNVTPALAVDIAHGQRAFVAWADSSQTNVNWQIFDFDTEKKEKKDVEDGGAMGAFPVRGLGVAPSRGGWLLAFTDADGLKLRGYGQEGQAAWSADFNVAPGDIAGDPVLSPSPEGPVAVVWPVYYQQRATVGLKALVVDPFAVLTDGGVPDAGIFDGGLPGPGDRITFDTSGCTCASSAGAAAWLVALLALLTRLARRRA